MDVSFFWVINQLIISITFIFIIHHIFHVFKKNLTIPKTKDLVKKPSEQYKEIYDTLHKDKSESEAEQNKKMKTELKNYLSSLTNTASKTGGIQSMSTGENGAFIHGINNEKTNSNTYTPYI